MYVPPFKVNDEILSLVADISESIGEISATMSSELPHPMLRKQNRIRTIQSSLAIENNSLTLEQVTAILEGKRVLGPPDDIAEVKGAIGAYEILQSVDAHCEKDLLRAHGLMMSGLLREAGRYRTTGVGVFGESGCVHLAPPAIRVPGLIADLFEWVCSTKTHPLVSSCVFHYEFEFIHPFSDGNGRMGRFWQTALLARWKPIFFWLPVETIVKDNQQAYYDAIAKSDALADSTPFIIFMLGCIRDSVKELSASACQISSETSSEISPETSPKDVIVSMIVENPSVTLDKMAIRLGMTKRNVQIHIKKLTSSGVIRRVGPNKGGHWEVVPRKE